MRATITIELADEQWAKLAELSRRSSVPMEELARIGIDALLRSPDEKFELAAQHALSKNAELYRRLA